VAFPPLAAEKLLGGQEGSIVFVGRGAGAIQSCGLPREVVSDQTAPQIRRVGSATRISIRRFFVQSTRQIIAQLSWRSRLGRLRLVAPTPGDQWVRRRECGGVTSGCDCATASRPEHIESLRSRKHVIIYDRFINIGG
jgi:hypothetical protein